MADGHVADGALPALDAIQPVLIVLRALIQLDLGFGGGCGQ